MFQVGLSEILLIVLIAFIVLGPEQLPKAATTLGKWFSYFRKLSKKALDEINSLK